MSEGTSEITQYAKSLSTINWCQKHGVSLTLLTNYQWLNWNEPKAPVLQPVTSGTHSEWKATVHLIMYAED